jgi:hypothetical protein
MAMTNRAAARTKLSFFIIVHLLVVTALIAADCYRWLLSSRAEVVNRKPDSSRTPKLLKNSRLDKVFWIGELYEIARMNCGRRLNGSAAHLN